MQIEAPQTIYLRDYEPPAWLIETIFLDVALHPEATRVATTLSLKPNPGRAENTAQIELDGEKITLQEVSIDGQKLNPDRYAVTPEKLIISGLPQRPLTLDIVTLCNPKANTELSGRPKIMSFSGVTA